MVLKISALHDHWDAGKMLTDFTTVTILNPIFFLIEVCPGMLVSFKTTWLLILFLSSLVWLLPAD